MEMTKLDVESYLLEIYKIPVVEVRTRIELGEFYRDYYKKYVKKRDDIKIAYVSLVSQKCTFQMDKILKLHHASTA